MNARDVLLHFCVVILLLSININILCEVIKQSANVTSPVSFHQNENSASQKQQINLSSVAEGGIITPDGSQAKDTTHQGREHTYINHMYQVNNDSVKKNDSVKDKLDEKPNNTQKTIASSSTTTTTTTTTTTILPPYAIPEKNDNKTSVAKKGVGLPTTNATTTTVKPKKKKPTITEHADEPPVISAKPILKNDSDDAKGPQVENLELLPQNQEKNQRKSDYIVPIVVVIMSVPLVAIIISVLYRRGAEWWQHRHYRRMDFLIEGMYNN